MTPDYIPPMPVFAQVDFPDVPFELRKHLVLLGRRGSEAHGTYVPPTDPNGIDDRDLMGICIPPGRFYYGLDNWEGAEEIKGVWDVVLYEFRKFVRLLLKQNPNVLSLLWLEPEDVLYASPVGQELIRIRSLFRSRELAYQSFVGYAHGQLHRMTSGEHRGFMGAKRKALVDKFGFDCKNGAHLIRLLHMGEEYMRTGELQVRRTTDVAMLREIKTGRWTLAEVQDYAQKLFAGLAYARDHSVLPEEIDRDLVDAHLVRLVRQHFAA